MLNTLVHRFFLFAPPSGEHDDRARHRRAYPKDTNSARPADEVDDECSGSVAEIQRVPRVIAGIPQDEILRRLQSREMSEAQGALEVLYEALFKQLWHVAYRTVRAPDLAEEMVQDVFLNLWEQRESLVIRGALSLYLHVAIRNRAYDHVRRREMTERHATAQQEDCQSRPAFWPSATVTPADTFAETETDRALRAALAGISVRDRDVLLLRWRDGWSFKEIGQALGLSSVAARTVVTRQQRRLRVFLDRLREELQEP